MIVSRSAGILSDFGQELPGPVDRLALEVVAEAEIAQHLEERLVEGGPADVVDVAGAQAFLAGGGPGEVGVAQPHELVLELVHAGGREQHRRVVGHQHVAGAADAALGLEEVEVRFAKFVCFHDESVLYLTVTGPRSVSSVTGPSQLWRRLRSEVARASSAAALVADLADQLALLDPGGGGRRPFLDLGHDDAGERGIEQSCGPKVGEVERAGVVDAQAAPGLGAIGGDDLAIDGELGQDDRPLDRLVAAADLEPDRVAGGIALTARIKRIEVDDRRVVDGDDLVVDLKLSLGGRRVGLTPRRRGW